MGLEERMKGLEMECLRCKEKMIVAKLNTGAYGNPVYLSNKKKGILESEQRSSVTCYVCPKCGYVELKADSPGALVLK